MSPANDTSELLESFERGVLTLTINRPDAHNTMSFAVNDALRAALGRAAVDPEVRCIVLTGAGTVFCAGGDIGDQESGANFELGDSPEDVHAATVRTFRRGMEITKLLHDSPKPTVAVMPGAAAGSGLALALACDLRFCLDTAKLTTAYAKVGLSGDSGISWLLPRIVGPAKAKELLFSADVLSGAEALDIGLVTRVASSEDFAADAESFVRHVVGLPTVALGLMKENLRAAHDATLDEILDLEAENVVRSMETEDHQNAAAAFMKKESVTFRGR